MAIIKYRVKSRGRPRELDTNLIYQEIVQATKKALPRLEEIRQSTKGYRGERVLGSKTSVPDWVEESLDLLQTADYGRDLSVSEAVSITQTLKNLRELASPQERVYGRAIGEQLTKEYVVAFGEFNENGQLTNFSKDQIKEIEKNITFMSIKERQEYFTSRYYQDPRATGKYKRVLAWSKADSGRAVMSYDEAWSYLFRRRLEDFMYGD